MNIVSNQPVNGQFFPQELHSENAPNPLIYRVSTASSKVQRCLQGEPLKYEEEKEKLPAQPKLERLIEGAPFASSFKLNKLGRLNKKAGKFTTNEIKYWRDRSSKGDLDPDDLSAEMQKKIFRPVWNTFKKMAYDRCGEGGKNVLNDDLNSLSKLLKAKGLPPEGYTLHRIDNSNPEYSVSNTEWASPKRQTWERGITRFPTDNTGECAPVEEWANRKGITGKLILQRIDRDGWPEHDAIHTPKGHRRPTSTGPQRFVSASPLVSVWKEALKDTPDCQFWSFTAAEKKMLKDWGNRIGEGQLNATEVLPFVLRHWERFTFYVKKHKLLKGELPPIPNMEFLVKYCTSSGNFFLCEPERIAEDEACRVEFRYVTD